MRFHKESEHEKYYKEIIKELSEVKVLEKGYKFGVASVLLSLLEWIDEVEKLEIDELKTDEIKQAFKKWTTSDDEIGLIIERLTSNK